MSDSLVEAVRRAGAWPAGSGARQTLTKAAGQLMAKRQKELQEAEELLNRQWAWLDRESPGDDDAETNSARYEDGMKRYLLTLANYEDMADGLRVAEAELVSLTKPTVRAA